MLWRARVRGAAFCCAYLPGAAHCLAVGGEAGRVHLFNSGTAPGRPCRGSINPISNPYLSIPSHERLAPGSCVTNV